MQVKEHSLNLLRRIAKTRLDDDFPLFVNFSGGKDSLCCLLLALEVSDNVECLYMDSGQELPNTLPYVQSRCKEFGVKLHISHPCRDRIPHRVIPKHICLLPDYVKYFGYFPLSVKRYCSIWLKQRPLRIYLRKLFGRAMLFKITGIRLSESAARRRKYGSVEACKKYGGRNVRPDREYSGSYLVMPLLDWTEEDVAAFLKEKKVEIHQDYKVFGISGCAWCPVMKPETAQKIQGVYPHIYDDLLEAERVIGKPAWHHKKVWLKDIVNR